MSAKHQRQMQHQQFQQPEELSFTKSFDSVRKQSIIGPDPDFWRRVPHPS